MKKPHFGAAFLLTGTGLEPCRLNPAHLMGNQNQHEQDNRETDAKTECLYGAIAFSLVLHQEKQSRPKAGKNQNECDGNEYFHGGDDGPEDAVTVTKP